jgi:HEAT repeat protein
MMHLTRRAVSACLVSACLVSALALFGDGATLPAAATDPGDEGAVAAAISQMRGVHYEGMTTAQKTFLGERLDKAWNTLMERREVAKPAVLKILATERDDNFLIVDLAYLLTVLDPGSLEPAAAALARAKVTADPPGMFHASANMAAHHCAPCLPAVLRILEIKNPDTELGEHGPPVDPEMMLIFTLGQYGDDAIGPVGQKLSSENCVVRGNAALALGLLQPSAIPDAIHSMATSDTCDEARSKAWVALGLLDDPRLADAITKRLKTQPRAPRIERLGMSQGLGASFSPSAQPPLRALAKDPDTQVASMARHALLGVEEMQRRMDQVKKDRAGVPAKKRAKMIKRLEKAVQEGSINLGPEPDDLLTTLATADVPLLNRARAAVLADLSSECLDAYYPMTQAVRALRTGFAGPAG